MSALLHTPEHISEGPLIKEEVEDAVFPGNKLDSTKMAHPEQPVGVEAPPTLVLVVMNRKPAKRQGRPPRSKKRVSVVTRTPSLRMPSSTEKAGNCLLCFCKVEEKRQSLSTGTALLEDNTRVIFILKRLLQCSSDELISFLQKSRGDSPCDWIDLCQECHQLVQEAWEINEQIKRLEGRLRQCMEVATGKIKVSSSAKRRRTSCSNCKRTECTCKTKMRLTHTIRNLVYSRETLSTISTEKTGVVNNSVGVRDCVNTKNSWLQDPAAAVEESVITPDLDQIGPGLYDTEHFSDDNYESPTPSSADGDGLDDPSVDPNISEQLDESDPTWDNEQTSPRKRSKVFRTSRRQSKAEVQTKKIKLDVSTVKTRKQYLGGSYKCPLCPNLPTFGPMTTQQYVAHIIFHTDNTMQCTRCKSFLKKDPQKLDEHWTSFHADVKEESNSTLKYIEVDLTPLNTFECGHCNKQFLQEDERDSHAHIEHDMSTVKSVDCPNCEGKFCTTHEMKLHQALKHPNDARVSCIACLETFGKEDDPHVFNVKALRQHYATSHPGLHIHRIRTCVLCGVPFKANFGSGGFGLRFHVTTFHSDLAKTFFNCSECDLSHSSVLEHQLHINEAHSMYVDKRLISTGSEGLEFVHFLRTSPMLLVRCGLCVRNGKAKCNSRSSGIVFSSEKELYEHLKTVHKLVVKVHHSTASLAQIMNVPKNSKRQRKLAPKRVLSTRKPKPMVILNPVTPNGQLGGKESSSFSCPTCEHLQPMTLNEYIVHILFHYRQPLKCTECDWYLPNVQKLIDLHWHDYHSTKASSVHEKFIRVDFSPGDIWNCAECDRQFPTFVERDKHEKDEHSLDTLRSHLCSICSMPFRSVDEVRLHKAQSHPDAAELCCTHCDVTLKSVSIEGIEFRNPRLVYDHLEESHQINTNRERKGLNRARKSNIEACSMCGKVFTMIARLLEHYSENHGVRDDKQTACMLCHRQVSYRSLQRHLYSVHVSKYPCEICGVEVKVRQMKSHMFSLHRIVDDKSQVYKCEAEGCAYETIRLGYFNNHLKSHDTSKKFACQYCGKSFSTICHLRRHEKIHVNADSKPYVCQTCNKAFPVRNYLYTHIRVNHLKNWGYKYKKKKKE